jgi:MFS family permease
MRNFAPEAAMLTSLFIAKLIGPILIAAALSILIDEKSFRAMMKDLFGSRALVYWFGILDLLLGLVLVAVHNVWVWDWRVIITVIGWLSIVRGLVRILCTAWVIKNAPKLLRKEGLLMGVSIVMLIIGAVLSYYGYAGLLRA